MSGKRVLALYAAILFSFAVILCRLYFLAETIYCDILFLFLSRASPQMTKGTI